VHVAPAGSPFETDVLFLRLARRREPETYREMLTYRDAWFVKVDPAASPGRFMRSNHVFADRCRYAGPLADKHAAARYVELIEDAFGLCRCEAAYAEGPPPQPTDASTSFHTRSRCLLHQMGKCVGLGVGAISLGDYRRVVAEAADFAADRGAAYRKRLAGRMQRAAAERRFEEAAAIKATLEKLVAAGARKFAHVCGADAWRMLIFQPAGGRLGVRPFVFTAGRLRRWAFVGRNRFADAAGPLLAAAREPVPPPADEEERRSAADGFALLAHHLFSRQRGRGLFLPVDDRMSAQDVTAAVAAHFAKPRRPAKAKKPNVHHPDASEQPPFVDSRREVL
jgi:hypothetical protein